MWEAASQPAGFRVRRDVLIAGALGVYEVGQLLLLIESIKRLNLMGDGSPAYAVAIAWIHVFVVTFWMIAVAATAAAMLQAGARRAQCLLAAACSVSISQSLAIAGAVTEAVRVTNLVPATAASSAVTSALAVLWLAVVAESFNLLSFVVAALAFKGGDWTGRRSTRHRLLSVAFGVWALASGVALAANLVLLLETPLPDVAHTSVIEETVGAGLVLAAAVLAAVAFGLASVGSVGTASRDRNLVFAAIALIGLYAVGAVNHFSVGSHVQVHRLKTLYELQAWGSVLFAVAAVGLCAALVTSRWLVSPDRPVTVPDRP